MGQLFESITGMPEVVTRLGRRFVEMEIPVPRQFGTSPLGMPVGTTSNGVVVSGLVEAV